jgi:phenylacetyl-CoA:acceptor oxidoreductase 26-kDa subunit
LKLVRETNEITFRDWEEIMLSGQKQNAWKLPALLNLTLGGMGAGYYLIALLLILPHSADWTQSLVQTAMFKLLGPLLVIVGLLSLTVEAGHPFKSIYLLTNLRNSWMSREALAAGIFILAAGLDWLMPSPMLRCIAGLAALVFIIAQGMIVWRASGVFTWNTPVVPWFFLTCALLTGSGVMLLVSRIFSTSSWVSLPFVTVIIAISNSIVWLVYLKTPGEVFQRETKPLRQMSHIARTLGVGHALPIALLVIALTMPLPLVIPLAGAALIFGGVIQKSEFAFEASSMRSVMQK